VKSQILCQPTAKLTCGLKLLALTDSEVRTVNVTSFKV